MSSNPASSPPTPPEPPSNAELKTQKALPLEKVLECEAEEIGKVRENRRIQAKLEKFETGAPRSPEIPPFVRPAGRPVPEWQSAGYGEEWRDAIANAHRQNFAAVAFSGGGIRSATFNLGVLQALAKLNLLRRIDYLSTVSGGGYIGGWLAAWIKRSSGQFAEVEEELIADRVDQHYDSEPREIRFLRIFSNYLTPQTGILSGDTWAMIGIYVRNTLLNQVEVLAMVATALLLPRLALRWGLAASSCPLAAKIGTAAAVVLFLIALLFVWNSMEYLDSRGQSAESRLTKPFWVLLLIGGPLFFDAIVAALWLHSLGTRALYAAAAILGGVTYGLVWAFLVVLGSSVQKGAGHVLKKITSFLVLELYAEPEITAVPQPELKPRRRRTYESVLTVCAAFLAGAFSGWLYAIVASRADAWTVDWELTLGVPLVMATFLLGGTLHVGLMGIAFPDRRREWWGRLGGELLLGLLLWAAIFALALHFPQFVETNSWVSKTWTDISEKYLTAAWILSTAGSVLAGKSGATGKPGTQTWKDVVAKVGPYVFVVGLLCLVSYEIYFIQCAKFLSDDGGSFQGWSRFAWANTAAIWFYPKSQWALAFIGAHRLYCAILGCAAIAVLLGWRVDINQFSLHTFYRNRLTRCYLGASNKKRRPNRFTGFDSDDDVPLKNLRLDPGLENDKPGKPYNGPYPILNSSLNLVKGADLAWQERKAASFVMTPFYCGYDVWLEEQDSPLIKGHRDDEEDQEKIAAVASHQGVAPQGPTPQQRKGRGMERFGYRPTEHYAFPDPGRGFFLGTAMGISGAAVSPNMGFYTSVPVAFLMTVFNVRLGQWSGNPRSRSHWIRSSPRLGLSYMVNELVGGTDDEANYVYLSDGGHFENLALYELVKRRCGLIIACDAEEDHNYEFNGLGNAIRKCRIDLGIDIELDVSGIAPEKSGEPSKAHCAVGKIHYEQADMNAPTGTIIYFKASLTGDEPTDIRNYVKKHTAFPHDSTAEQWFTESQFESYRQLGYHEVMSSILGKEASPVATASAPGPAPATGPASSAKPANPAEDLKTASSDLIRTLVSALGEAAAKFFAGKASDAEGAAKPAGEADQKKKSACDQAALPDKLLCELQKFGFDDSKIKKLRNIGEPGKPA